MTGYVFEPGQVWSVAIEPNRIEESPRYPEGHPEEVVIDVLIQAVSDHEVFVLGLWRHNSVMVRRIERAKEIQQG